MHAQYWLNYGKCLFWGTQLFLECKKTRDELKIIPICEYYDIFDKIDTQIESINVFIKTYKLRNRSVKKKQILPVN